VVLPLAWLVISTPRSETLSRASIIRRRSVFDAARNKGRRVNNPWMTLSFLPRDRAESAKVAFLTPKRLGRAVVRNRLRRQMRDIYRRHLQRPDDTHSCVWIARPPALELDFDGLKKAMSELAGRKGA
jgi:ribonuclease P protein component